MKTRKLLIPGDKWGKLDEWMSFMNKKRITSFRCTLVFIVVEAREKP